MSSKERRQSQQQVRLLLEQPRLLLEQLQQEEDLRLRHQSLRLRLLLEKLHWKKGVAKMVRPLEPLGARGFHLRCHPIPVPKKTPRQAVAHHKGFLAPRPSEINTYANNIHKEALIIAS
jgi:hypothetical protein